MDPTYSHEEWQDHKLLIAKALSRGRWQIVRRYLQTLYNSDALRNDWKQQAAGMLFILDSLPRDEDD